MCSQVCQQCRHRNPQRYRPRREPCVTCAVCVGVWAWSCMHAWVHGGGGSGSPLTLFGRTAEIMVKFDPKCSLETHHDRLVFYGDKQGTRVLRTYAAGLLQPC